MPPPRITASGHILIILRTALLLAVLLTCVPLYHLWRLLGLRQIWPRIFMRGVTRIAGLRIFVTGMPRRGVLLLANHVSWLDIPALCGISGTAFIAHDGLARNGVLKHLAAMNDTVFIPRHRRTAIQSQIDQLRAALSDTGAVTLFPEGTTGDGITLLPFKSALLSAIEPLPAGIAVQPVLLRYAQAPEIAWLGEEPGIDNFKRIMAQWTAITLDIHFLPPLDGESLRDRKTIAAAAREAIADAMADSTIA